MDWKITCRISFVFWSSSATSQSISSLSHFNGCWKTFIADTPTFTAHNFRAGLFIKGAFAIYCNEQHYSFTQMPWVGCSSNALLAKSINWKAKAGKSATRHITGWKNYQYIHAKGQLFQGNNLLGLQNCVYIQNIYNRKLQTNKKIIHFECSWVLQLKSLLIALQSLLGGPWKHNI
jgi:hypothetical protein